MIPYFTTPPLAIIDLPADAQHRGGTRMEKDIEFIFLHSTEGVDSRKWLTTDPQSNVSCHRLIRRTKGEHYKCMDDLVVANTQGGGTIGEYRPGKLRNLNTVGLSIELERHGTQGYTQWQFRECILMCAEWWGRYGPIPILSHKVVDPTRRRDPVRFDWPLFRRELLDYVAPLILASKT